MVILLEVVKNIQSQLPGSAIGGSIGLALQGIDIGRPLDDSDFDFVIPKELEDQSFSLKGFDLMNSSSPETMHYCFINGCGTKIDIQVADDVPTILLGGIRVVKAQHTIGWKIYYASQGSEKHQGDLYYICFKNRNKPTKLNLNDIGTISNSIPGPSKSWTREIEF